MGSGFGMMPPLPSAYWFIDPERSSTM